MQLKNSIIRVRDFSLARMMLYLNNRQSIDQGKHLFYLSFFAIRSWHSCKFAVKETADRHEGWEWDIEKYCTQIDFGV